MRAPWTLRVKEVFWPTPAPKPGEGGEPDRIPSERRKEVMRSLDPQEVKLAFGAFALATIAGIAIPVVHPGNGQGDQSRQAHDCGRAGRRRCSVGVIIVLCILGFVTLWKRKRTFVSFALFLIGFAFTALHRADRVRLHPRRRLAHAARLAHQPLRDDRREGHPPGGRQPAHGAGSRRVGIEDSDKGQGFVAAGRPEAADREQALHAEGASSEEDPETHRVAAAGRAAQRPGSTSSAERSSWSTSARRRTNERAVGSSPSARSTSTSVTIPITVE